MARVFHRVWRSAIWLCLLILALNIENVATSLGIDQVLVENATAGQRLMRGTLDFLQSTPVLYVVAFLMGGSVFAWGLSLLQKLDKEAGRPSLWKTANDCEALSNGLRWYRIFWWLGVPKFTEQTNRKLKAIGITEVSVHDLSNKDERMLVAAYFRAVGSLIESRDLEGAKLLWTVYEHRLSSVRRPEPTGVRRPS